jgi:hypothetical protein
MGPPVVHFFHNRSILLRALIVCLLLAAAAFAQTPQSPESIALLLPDATNADDPGATVWLDAAAEEGLHVIAVHDSDFAAHASGYSGVILPDAVHRQADAALVSAVESYVSAGGNLMLVYDAGTLDARGLYPLAKSRFSNLAGVDFAFYTTLRDNTIQRAPVLGSAAILDALQIPPGKAVPFFDSLAGVAPDLAPLAPAEGPFYTIDTYYYGHVPYASFVNRGKYDGEVLLRSIPGLVAGYRHSGRGSVLYVNLALGSLALRTDALLLHGFLHYFGTRAGLPTLASVPDGTGGLVLNWHLDSNAALKPMETLKSIGFYDQGPFSYHITAGPDRDVAGDHLGLDVPHNPRIQEWIKFLLQRGNTIGDHGGWIHNYFGAHLTEEDKSFELYLKLNTQALEAVTGTPIVEYSAPVGNHPKWVTQWLEAHGFFAYYFTGNTGVGPTKSYRDGVRSDHTIWSFPILTLGKAASLEDLHQAGVGDADVSRWLTGVTDFAVRHRVCRLVYAHPPGAEFFSNALRVWLEKTAAVQKTNQFRWYTMTAAAEFLNARQQVQWTVSTAQDGASVVSANHPATLAHQTWFLPRSAFTKPLIKAGAATVRDDGERWIVVAGDGKNLRFSANRVPSRAKE